MCALEPMGVISKPLREGEIQNLVDQLFEDKGSGKIEREPLEEEEGGPPSPNGETWL